MLEGNPSNGVAMFNLANVHRQLDEMEAAVELYGRCIASSRQQLAVSSAAGSASSLLPAASMNLGNVLQQQGKYEEAVGQVRKTLHVHGPEVGTAPAFYSCIPTGTHGSTCIF